MARVLRVAAAWWSLTAVNGFQSTVPQSTTRPIVHAPRTSDTVLGASLSSTPENKKNQPSTIQTPYNETGKLGKLERVALLVCPAQFCVPDDYAVLFENLRALSSDDAATLAWPRIGTCVVAPLPRTEWIRVARQLPTRAFWDARLPVHSTLDWYFDAIEKGLAQIFAQEGEDVRICIVGHSIGGWVARAYLGGLGRTSSAVYRLASTQVSSLITLGTPHVSPELALVDQTRGLLREIADAESCSPETLAARGIDVTCVCSQGLDGNFWTTNVEELVAASSYWPLSGSFRGAGDGIVPLSLAFMEEPSRRIVVESCGATMLPVRHSHVVPTPWNLWNGYAPSIILPDATFPSYVSKGVVAQWAQYIR